MNHYSGDSATNALLDQLDRGHGKFPGSIRLNFSLGHILVVEEHRSIWEVKDLENTYLFDHFLQMLQAPVYSLDFPDRTIIIAAVMFISMNSICRFCHFNPKSNSISCLYIFKDRKNPVKCDILREGF